MLIDEYILEERLGSGGFGSVWRARHRPTGLTVAIKLVLGGLEPAGRHRTVRALAREIDRAADLDHPAIVAVVDHGKIPADQVLPDGRPIDGGTPYLVMEHAPHGSLDRWCTPDAPPVEWWDLREVLLAVLSGLAHAHARGLLHRDLKPGNVLLGRGRTLGEQVRIADFGITTTRLDSPAEAGIAGTLRYMAPEQRAGWHHLFGPPTDLYALGAMAWELATGSSPHGPEGPPRLQGAPPPPVFFAPRSAMPPAFEDWLRRCLAVQPWDRLTDAPAAAALLRRMDAEGAIRSGTWMEDETYEVPAASPPSWRAAGRRSAAFASRGASLRWWLRCRPPFVGREDARDRLWATVVSPSVGVCCLIRGDTGVGKSAVLRWLGEAAAEVGTAEVLALKATAYDPGIVHAVRAWLRLDQVTRVAPGDHLDAALGRLGLAPVHISALARVVAPELQGDSREGQPSAADRNAATLPFLRALARRHPLLVTIDDADRGPESWAFTQWLAEAAPKCGFRLVATAKAGCPRGAFSGVLDLPPLPDGDLVDLIRATLDVAAGVTERIRAGARGRSDIALAHLTALVDRHALQPGPRGLEPVAGSDLGFDPVGEAPRSALVRERLGRAEPGARAGAWALVALGPEVADHEWAAVVRLLGIADASAGITGLREAGVVAGRTGGWTFVDLAGWSELRAAGERAPEWPAVARACADVLASTSPDPRAAARRAALLVSVGADGEALPLLEEAAGLAQRGCRYSETARLLDQWAAAATSAAVPPEEEMWGRLALARAALCLETGQIDGAADALEGLMRAGRRAGWSRLEASTLRRQGMVDLRRARPGLAIGSLERAEELALRGGELWEAARAATHLGTALRRTNDRAAARAAFGRALERFETLDDRLGIADVLAERANLELASGGNDEQIDRDLHRSLTLCEELGRPVGVAYAANSLGDRARRAGRAAEAADWYRKSLSLLTAAAHPQRVFASLNLALLALDRGDPAAVGELERLAETMRELRRDDLAAYPAVGLLVARTDPSPPAEWEAATKLLADSVARGSPDPDLASLADAAAARAAREHQRARAVRLYDSESP